MSQAQIGFWWKAALSAVYADGSLDIADSTLSVSAGSSVDLRVRLGTRPRSDVTVALTESEPTGNEQTIDLPSAAWTENIDGGDGWEFATGRPAIDAGLEPAGEDRYFHRLSVRSNGLLALRFQSAAAGAITQDNDLTDTFEQSGTIEVTVGGTSWIFALGGADVREPYVWVPSNAATDGVAFYNAVQSATDATITLRDFDPTPFASVSPTSLTFMRANWDTYQDVTVTGDRAGTTTITLTASGPVEYAGVTATATATVT